jgi:hypothetical protein
MAGKHQNFIRLEDHEVDVDAESLENVIGIVKPRAMKSGRDSITIHAVNQEWFIS